MLTPGMYSSHSCEWETPQEFFDRLDDIYHFDLDVCATAQNTKCSRYFTRAQDGLSQNWAPCRCWMPPPYGTEIKEWVEKASESETLVVGLLPARLETQWFNKHVYGKAEIIIVEKRLRFGGGASTAPFGSIVAVWNDHTVDLAALTQLKRMVA